MINGAKRLNDISIVIIAQDDQMRRDMAAILGALPYTTRVSRLPQVYHGSDETFCVYIVALSDDGNGVARLVGEMLDDHPSNSAIFVIPKRPDIPTWTAQFSGKRVGFYATDLIDAGLLSYVTAFMTHFMP